MEAIPQLLASIDPKSLECLILSDLDYCMGGKSYQGSNIFQKLTRKEEKSPKDGTRNNDLSTH